MTKTTLRLATVLLLVGAILAPAANAEPASPELETDYAAGLAWWNVTAPPLCTSVTLEMSSDTPDPLAHDDPAGSEVAATATQPSPSTPTPCLLTVYAAWSGQSPCMKAMTIRHEVGHLLGHGHSTDPASIMHAPIEVSVWCPSESTQASSSLPASQPPLPEIPSAAESARASDIAWFGKRWRQQVRRCKTLRGRHAGRGQTQVCWANARFMRNEYDDVLFGP